MSRLCCFRHPRHSLLGANLAPQVW